MGEHRNLVVWQRSQDLAEAVFRIAAAFPKHEQFALASQMRRSCSSISSNIAEGTGKLGDREMARYLRIARGSASELDSQIDLCRRVGYISKEQEAQLLEPLGDIRRMLFVLINRLTVTKAL